MDQVQQQGRRDAEVRSDWQRDYLSVFLATSPGGLDSLSIIAMEAGGDVGLVVTLQTLRLFAVVLLTPPLVRLCLRLFERNVGAG